jgi:hypothetical protein
MKGEKPGRRIGSIQNNLIGSLIYTGYFISEKCVIVQEMKQIQKQKINPDSFDRETIMLGVWETRED